MNFENLIYKEIEETAWILLNRPEVMNALSMKLSEEIVAAIEIVRQSTEIKFLVIRGEGNNFVLEMILKK